MEVPAIRLDERHLRLLYSMSLYRGSSSELDLLPMQPAATRPFTAAKSLSTLASYYPDLLDRSRSVGMRDALQGEIAARRGGDVKLPPAFHEDAGPAALTALEVQRAA